MKLISYRQNGIARLGLLKNGIVHDTALLESGLPGSMDILLNNWSVFYPRLQEAALALPAMQVTAPYTLEAARAVFMAPVPCPPSCRDAYAFRQHVETARRNRNLSMLPEFDQYPVFYFTNHHSIQGPGPVLCMPDHLQKLDFELEVAIVICQQGRNIKAAEADRYIGGLMIMNDMSARQLQQEEMLLNLGPAKGKDFATCIGPWLVTPDELQPFSTAAKPGHTGSAWNLTMQCYVNGVQVSKGNLADMEWTFAEIIERASYGATLYPGDIIGSGTVGTGCFLELNGTGKWKNPQYKEQWLQPGDEIVMEVTGLGRLVNTIEKEADDFSLLAQKKMLS